MAVRSAQLAVDLASGKVETMVNSAVLTAARMEDRDASLMAQRDEESEERIADMLERGLIGEEEARKLRARRMMHEFEGKNAKEGNQFSQAAMAGAELVTTEQMIEEALQGPSVNPIVACLWKTFRLQRVADWVEKERRRRSAKNFKHRFPLTTLLVQSRTFELLMFCIVAANALFLGFQISISKTPLDLPAYSVIEETFTVLFVIEVILRLMGNGWVWIFDAGNAADVSLILITGVIPNWIVTPVFGVSSTEIRLGQVFRCVRMIRIIKSVRTIGIFRTLWSLISGVVDSGRILVWTLTIICVVLYMFSIFFVSVLVKGNETYSEVQEFEVMFYFRDVPTAMFTLFQVMTLDSWTSVSRPMQGQDKPHIAIYFLVVVAVTSMVLTNLVIAVIVNNAFARALKDEELQAAMVREVMESEKKSLTDIFDLMDTDGTKLLSREEYAHALHDEDDPDRGLKIKAKLRVSNLADDEIEDLWGFLEFPEEINLDEWCTTIRNLKGDCKAKHSFGVCMNMKKLDQRIQDATDTLASFKDETAYLHHESLQVQKELTSAIFEVRQFLIAVNRCIPQEPVPLKTKALKSFQDDMMSLVGPLLGPDLSEASGGNGGGGDWNLPGAISDRPDSPDSF
mmetsp:Transcript_50461/g.81830  ORF Transcript_50461/g.81830 Transcript_50461/m.81830 type:complete len:627 (-) Transcript_50461:254-2134(-)